MEITLNLIIRHFDIIHNQWTEQREHRIFARFMTLHGDSYSVRKTKNEQKTKNLGALSIDKMSLKGMNGKQSGFRIHKQIENTK